MNIPELPQNSQIVDSNGNLTQQYRLFFEDLITALQQRADDEGIYTPRLKTTDIAQLTNYEHHGMLVYDSDLNVLKTNLNGVIKTITTS